MVNYGFYNIDIDIVCGSCSCIGEYVVIVLGWQGVGFGEDGFLIVLGEYLNCQVINCVDFDLCVMLICVIGWFGDLMVEQYSVFVNVGMMLFGMWKLYGWFGYQDCDICSVVFLCFVNVMMMLVGYFDGFLLLINIKLWDFNLVVGIKGVLFDWNVDLNVSYGCNKIGFCMLNFVNYVYGVVMLKDFFDGVLVYDQLIVGFDVDCKFDVLQGVNVVFGIEGWCESFQIQVGEFVFYGVLVIGVVVGVVVGV